MRDRVIQLMAALAVLVSVVGASALVPRMLSGAETLGLRYTADPIEGAPPIIALANAIGAIRPIVADYLWIKLAKMKEKGQFYEASSLASWITKLQPRFPEVWAFHGHNMAYNISVLTNTPQERWSWVNQGIDLVRNQGLRYNPNDLGLNKELAFWFAHKIDGVSDDAHLFYKREFAREWQYLLGIPPFDQEERERWIQAIADAPDTYAELVALHPDVQKVVDRLTSGLSPYQRRFSFKFDRNLLNLYGQWKAIETSPYARLMELDQGFRRTDPLYVAISEVFRDPELQVPLEQFITWLRKRVLLDTYNMDPVRMAQYTKEYGPFDWRHPQAHAFYWAKLGSETGAERYDNIDDVYKQLNNDRLWLQAIQALQRSGLMSFDPFSNDNPTRLNDPRWIQAANKAFRNLYDHYYDRSRGGGVDTFADFYENFMTSNVRELWRAGEIEAAQQIYTELDQLFGSTGVRPSNKYRRPIDVFVQETTRGEYEYVPDTAATDVYAALRNGFIQAYLMGRPERLKTAREFASGIIEFFKSTHYFNFVNKFGEGRMRDLIADMETTEERVFTALLKDSSISLLDRLTMYNRAPEAMRRLAYDGVRDSINREIRMSPIGQSIVERVRAQGRGDPDVETALSQAVTQMFPEPPGMEEWRLVRAERARQREEQRAGSRADFQTR
ncbi:MAG: hypothetical protein KF724_03870 [Phycisphaeraceae bacterium]|nr:hypothetical protein [Phycisphaeraceae bacterium]